MNDTDRINIMIGRLENVQKSFDEDKYPAYNDIERELEELGMKFGCSDCGAKYCLDIEGAIHVLKATRKIK